MRLLWQWLRRAWHDQRGLIGHALSAITVEASNDAEATTVSTTTADLRTFSGLSIPETDRVIVRGSWRKTSGAAASCTVGLKVNGTLVTEQGASSGTNQVESGSFEFVLDKQIANYLRCGTIHIGNGMTAAANTIAGINTANLPNAIITELIVTGRTDSAAQTFAVAGITVYRLAGS